MASTMRMPSCTLKVGVNARSPRAAHMGPLNRKRGRASIRTSNKIKMGKPSLITKIAGK